MHGENRFKKYRSLCSLELISPKTGPALSNPYVSNLFISTCRNVMQNYFSFSWLKNGHV